MKRFKWDFQGHRFSTTKGSSFCQKKSVKASLFSTHYISIYHNLPRCHQGWSCFCGHDGFANPKCLHLSLHRPMNQNYKQRYLDFIMCSGQFNFLVAGQNKSQTINVHCVFGHFGSGKVTPCTCISFYVFVLSRIVFYSKIGKREQQFFG